VKAFRLLVVVFGYLTGLMFPGCVLLMICKVFHLVSHYPTLAAIPEVSQVLLTVDVSGEPVNPAGGMLSHSLERYTDMLVFGGSIGAA
jgi:hypothetical protein